MSTTTALHPARWALTLATLAGETIQPPHSTLPGRQHVCRYSPRDNIDGPLPLRDALEAEPVAEPGTV